jgi:transposase
MGVPGIGVRSVLAYVSMVEDPIRFGRSRSVGAHLGLTPKQYQSGEIDRSGRISKCGDTLARTLMYEAAVMLMTRVKRACDLKDWAQAIARRSGAGKARVALARNRDPDTAIQANKNLVDKGGAIRERPADLSQGYRIFGLLSKADF